VKCRQLPRDLQKPLVVSHVLSPAADIVDGKAQATMSGFPTSHPYRTSVVDRLRRSLKFVLSRYLTGEPRRHESINPVIIDSEKLGDALSMNLSIGDH
jgi:hypothetical protein